DLAHIAKLVHIPVFGQHVDAVEPGQTTGWTPPEALLEAGAAGTLINHSERKVAWEEMAQSVPRCRRLGLEVIACADDIAEAENLHRPVRARGPARAALLAALVLASSPLWAESEAEPLLPRPRPASAPFSDAPLPDALLVRVYANTARDDEFVEIANPRPESS